MLKCIGLRLQPCITPLTCFYLFFKPVQSFKRSALICWSSCGSQGRREVRITLAVGTVWWFSLQHDFLQFQHFSFPVKSLFPVWMKMSVWPLLRPQALYGENISILLISQKKEIKALRCTMRDQEESKYSLCRQRCVAPETRTSDMSRSSRGTFKYWGNSWGAEGRAEGGAERQLGKVWW